MWRVEATEQVAVDHVVVVADLGGEMAVAVAAEQVAPWFRGWNWLPGKRMQKASAKIRQQISFEAISLVIKEKMERLRKSPKKMMRTRNKRKLIMIVAKKPLGASSPNPSQQEQRAAVHFDCCGAP